MCKQVLPFSTAAAKVITNIIWWSVSDTLGHDYIFYADSSIEDGTVGGAPPGAPEPSQLGKFCQFRVPFLVARHRIVQYQDLFARGKAFRSKARNSSMS